MVQRYKFESKSQPLLIHSINPYGCFQWFKGTNLKANHNRLTPLLLLLLLFPMVQRYKFESKSQRRRRGRFSWGSCFQWFKGTNLKANHNLKLWEILILKLFPMVQRYKFESKSQLRRSNMFNNASCFQWFKGTNLKANHNLMRLCKLLFSVVSNGSKVQIWKQITTDTCVELDGEALFPMVQRYKFESKSQPIPSSIMPYFVVSNGSKVQIWKQITTACSYGNSGSRIVSNGSKIRIWKQITTAWNSLPQ